MDIRERGRDLDRATVAELRVSATQALSRCCAACRRVLRDQLVERGVPSRCLARLARSTQEASASLAGVSDVRPPHQGHRRAAGERFFALFNQRKLDELMTLFLTDARTYYVRRGDPVTSEFKESGTAEIRQMLSERMASGETIQAGTIVTVSSGGSTIATGTFPDGTTRRLDVKYGYDCRRPSIGQLLITPIG